MEEESAKLIAAAMVLFAEVSGMNAENAQRQHRGESLVYSEYSYAKAIERFVTEAGNRFATGRENRTPT